MEDKTIGVAGERLKTNQFLRLVKKSGLLLIFVALMVVASILSPKFLTYQNLFNILRQISILGVLAVGMTFVIISNGIDLSVGNVLSLSCVLVPLVAPLAGGNVLVICVICVLMGTLMGTCTGVLISYGGMQPFMATFGISTVAEGLAFLLSDGRPIIMSDTRWTDFGKGSTLGLPNLAIIFILIVVVGQFLISKTTYGVNTYAIGNNDVATNLCGVNTKRTRMIAYMISGMLAAVGGLLMTARVGVGDPGIGGDYALDTIASVIVGGTRMGGGYGSVLNSFLGAAMIGVLNNVFNLMGISAYPQMIFKGLIIIFAVLMGQKKK